jgi:hypothetical protein
MNYKFNKIFVTAALVFAANIAHAQFNFNNLTQGDLDGANKEFSHNFMFTTVSGASSLGSLWGFEIGVTGGMSDGDKISEIIKRSSPSSDFKDLYNVGLMGRVSIPFGLTVEAGLLPKIKVQDAELSQFAGAIRYNLIELPVAVGLRAHYSKTDFSFAQTSGAFTGTVDYDSDVYGVQALVSQNFVMIEPYAGLGFVEGKGDLEAAGSGSIGSFGNSGSSKQSSVQMMGGLNVHLGFLNLGAEYSRAFETNRITGKLSFGF